MMASIQFLSYATRACPLYVSICRYVGSDDFKLLLSYASLERFLYRRWRANTSLRNGSQTLYKLFLSTKKKLHSSQGVIIPQIVIISIAPFFEACRYANYEAVNSILYRMQLVHVLCTYESVGMMALMISKLFLPYARLERFLYRR